MALAATCAKVVCGPLLLMACSNGSKEQEPPGAWVIDPDSGLPAADAPARSWDGGDATAPPCGTLDGSEPESICGCTIGTSVDFTAQSTVTVPFTNKYEPRCIRVKSGTVVTWTGNFAAHPLWPSACAGDVERNPIHDVADVTATSLDIEFDELGTFPYYCPDHANDGPSPGGMCGVVYVVP